MREYELFYLVAASEEASLPTVRTDIEAIMTGEGGTFLPPETSDKRKLAYPIRGENRGTYIARRFTLPDASEMTGDDFEKVTTEKRDAIARIQQKLSLLKSVLRFLIVRAEELPELKQIERTEYAKREVRGRGGRPATVVARPILSKDAPLPNKDKEAPVVSKEEIDKQLEEVLDI